MTNILILSAGTRNKVVQYFKRELAGRGHVIATDSSSLSPAIYDADKFYVVPVITAPSYMDFVFGICEREKIDGVLSLIDPELELLAKNEERFSALCPELMSEQYNGVIVPGKSEYTIRIHSGIDVRTSAFVNSLKSLPKPTFVFVALGDDERRIHELVRMCRRFASRHGGIALEYVGGGRLLPHSRPALANTFLWAGGTQDVRDAIVSRKGWFFGPYDGDRAMIKT